MNRSSLKMMKSLKVRNNWLVKNGITIGNSIITVLRLLKKAKEAEGFSSCHSPQQGVPSASIIHSSIFLISSMTSPPFSTAASMSKMRSLQPATSTTSICSSIRKRRDCNQCREATWRTDCFHHWREAHARKRNKVLLVEKRSLAHGICRQQVPEYAKQEIIILEITKPRKFFV